MYSRLSWSSLCQPCWLWTHKDPPVSSSWVLGLKLCATTYTDPPKLSFITFKIILLLKWSVRALAFLLFLKFFHQKILHSCIYFCILSHLSYCCIAVKMHHDQRQLINRQFNWKFTYTFRGLVPNHHGPEHRSRQTGMVQQLKVYISIHGQEEESETGLGMSLSNLKAHPQLHTSSKKSHSSKSFPNSFTNRGPSM